MGGVTVSAHTLAVVEPSEEGSMVSILAGELTHVGSGKVGWWEETKGVEEFTVTDWCLPLGM